MIELQKQLIDNKLMKNNEQISLYESAVDEIFDKDNPECIEKLIQGFHDETEEPAVMWSNLHGIEYFVNIIGLKKYIEILFPKFKNMELDAYGWSETFFLRLINSDAAFKNILDYTVKIHNKKDKEVLVKLTNNLIIRNPQKFKEKGVKILNNLQKLILP